MVHVAASAGVLVRVLGGAAVHLQAPEGGPLLPRTINDIDIVARRGNRAALVDVLASAGYTPDPMFNALHGANRLLFYDETNERKLDVFVGTFSMCHVIPIAARLEREPITIPLAELLLTKLQIVELTERDQRDIYNLAYHHAVVDGSVGGIESTFIAELCARDWGLWRTTRSTVERCTANLTDYGLPHEATLTISERLTALWKRVEIEPKSAGWKLRSRVGDRVRWYNQPEETPSEA